MFDVEVHGIKEATPKQRDKFNRAVKHLFMQLNDSEFWYEVYCNYDSWKYKKGLSFDEFKTKFLSGKDNFNKDMDNDLDVYITFYYSFRSVVGYTTPSTWFTWINRKFFNSFELGDIAGNIAHEYLHNMGFDHPGTDRQSLVYKFGELVKTRVKNKIGINRSIYGTPKKRWYKRLWSWLF